MYRCESWTLKKAERRRIDAFELWCWRRLLRVPWTARRSNQSILKEISPGCSLEGLMLKLKLYYFGYLMRRVDSLEKTDTGSDWGQEEKGTTEDEMAGWHHQLDGHAFEWTLGVGDGQGGLACCISWGRKESDTTERLNWTELKLVPGSRINVLNLITLCLFFLYCHSCIFWDQQAEVVSHWFNWYSFIIVLCSYVILEETGGLYFVLVVFSVA